MTRVTKAALRDAARKHLVPGINPRIATILAFAELKDEPLDAEAFDDAAIILLAERLVLEDVPIELALASARQERVTFPNRTRTRRSG